MITAEIVDIQPHPDQATNNPGCWAVRFRIKCDGKTRLFWRWYTDRWAPKPKPSDILRDFWNDTFSEMRGFRFDKGSSL